MVGRGEFDDAGARFDTQVSRFAQVIDAHDTMVYCSNKAHKCIFSSLNRTHRSSTLSDSLQHPI